jgi:hypothetical protein
VTLRFEVSPDLLNWAPGDDLVRQFSIDPGQNFDTVELDIPSNEPVLFVRISASRLQ